MRIRNTFTSVLLIVGTAAAIAVIVAGWQTRRVQAIQDSEDRPNPFAFIELSAGQTARLNVVNLLSSRPPEPDSPTADLQTLVARKVRLAFDVYVQDPDFTPSCGGIVPVPQTCLVRHRFLRRESSEVELMPGQAASLNFTALEGAKVQAFIQTFGIGNTQATPEPHLTPSLEVREGNRTLFMVPGLAKFFNPQPDPPGEQR